MWKYLEKAETLDWLQVASWEWDSRQKGGNLYDFISNPNSQEFLENKLSLRKWYLKKQKPEPEACFGLIVLGSIYFVSRNSN